MPHFWVYIALTFIAIILYYIWLDKSIRRKKDYALDRQILSRNLTNVLLNYQADLDISSTENASGITAFRDLAIYLTSIPAVAKIGMKGGEFIGLIDQYLQTKAIVNGISYRINADKSVFKQDITSDAQITCYDVLKLILKERDFFEEIYITTDSKFLILILQYNKIENSTTVINDYIENLNSYLKKPLIIQKHSSAIKILIPNK